MDIVASLQSHESWTSRMGLLYCHYSLGSDHLFLIASIKTGASQKEFQKMDNAWRMAIAITLYADASLSRVKLRS